MLKSFDLLVAGVLLANGVNATTIDTKLKMSQIDTDKSELYDRYREHHATAHYTNDPYADWDYDDSESDG